MKESRRRVGLMGGTFDPIHIGHLMLAECAYEQFELEKVWFLPSGNPPHKADRRGGATDRERMEMVELAIRDNPHFALDPEEMYREGFTYTYDTLRLMRRKYPDTEFYFIIGADSLMAFDTWRNPASICRDCVLAVAVRDHLDRETILGKMRELEKKFQARIHLLRTPGVEISSSRLRRLQSTGRSIRYYVTDGVFEYINQKNIYSGQRAGADRG